MRWRWFVYSSCRMIAMGCSHMLHWINHILSKVILPIMLFLTVSIYNNYLLNFTERKTGLVIIFHLFILNSQYLKQNLYLLKWVWFSVMADLRPTFRGFVVTGKNVLIKPLAKLSHRWLSMNLAKFCDKQSGVYGIKMAWFYLTDCGLVMSYMVSETLVITGWGNGLALNTQAITSASVSLQSIELLGTIYSENEVMMWCFSFNMCYKRLSANWQPFCLDINVSNSTESRANIMTNRQQLTAKQPD